MVKKITLALLSLLLVPLAMMAQNVTVEPSTGSLVVALTEGTEVGFTGGWGALWRHEQLPLSFTVSDYVDLTDGGEVARPAGNLYNKDGKLVVLGGQSPLNGYMVLSLPKGYRFTGYKMVLVNDNIGVDFPGYGTIGGIQKSFYETDRNYDYSNYIARAEDENDNWTMASSNEPNTEYVIERTSVTDDDMSNQLYFVLRLHAEDSYAVLTIKSFEVYFTAEGNFTADVKPVAGGTARSVVQSPFKTSKMDIGDLKRETKTVNGVTRTFFAYNYNNVKDLDGYTYLYQSDAVTEGGEAVEGDEAKHIYPVVVDDKNQYAFGEGTYYVETPVTIHTQSGLEAPVGYRIVGAKFTPLWGTETSEDTETRTNYYIKYTSGGTDYYLNDQLRFTKNKFAWNQDRYGNIYATEGRYLSCTGSGNTRTLSWSTDVDGDWNLRIYNNYIYFDSWTYGTLYLKGRTDGATATLTSGNSDRARWTSEQETITIPAYKPGTYTLNIYKKTGGEGTANIQKSIEISSAQDADLGKAYDMGELNNDAVKFSITNLETGKQALVAISLELQALNPYIDQMNIVCHDTHNQLSLTQSFKSDNFRVSGGSFKFYIPTEFQNELLTFTFSDLYSKYGDNTYYSDNAALQKNGFARYSFVTSDYFTPINGNGNDGLYAAAYNPNATYQSKVVTSRAGNIRFKFNNAEDLVSSAQGTGHLEENPFSVEEYLGSPNPDATDGKPEGAFVDCQLKASSATQKSGTYYVFTADETRYNIAPTKAWQHRSYAFYRMEIELVANTYSPKLTWNKVYTEANTAYYKDGDAQSDMYGLELATTDSQTGADVVGYLTSNEINKAITSALGKTGAPATADQILYVDASNLYSVISSASKKDDPTTTDVDESSLSLPELKNSLAPNALFYLPERTTSTLDNFAYKTASGTFRAGKDIVLTDRNPFFAPYDIQVDGANYAKYTRAITWNKDWDYKKLATVILPYALDVTSGKHTEPSEISSSSFTLSKMTKMSHDKSETAQLLDYYKQGKALFETIDGDMSEPNVPYMVEISNTAGTDIPFTASQKGALVVATTGNGNYEGESLDGTIGTIGYSFLNQGGYSGVKLDAHNNDDNPGYFYFAAGKFLNSKNLNKKKNYVWVYPFRSYYSYTSSNPAKYMVSFDVTFDSDEIDGIAEIASRPDMLVKTGKGVITVGSATDNQVRIYGLNGVNVISDNLNSGDERTYTVPSGVYVVNGVKVIVK